jgi:two-component system, LytTR family, sensor kinase
MPIANNSSEKFSTEKMDRRDIWVEHPWFIWVLMFAFWTVLSTVLAIQDYLIWVSSPAKFSGWTAIFFNSYPYFYTWFALSPFIFFFGRKFGFGRREKNLRNLVIHSFLSVLFAAGYLAMTLLFVVPRLYDEYDLATFYREFDKRVYVVGHFQVIVYWAILGVCVSFDNYKKFRERETEAARLQMRSTKLESQLAKAQLDALKMQLHPHFLFNTLHAISALIEDHPKRARRMIARLGELLRSTLDISDWQTILLEKELALTRLYLEIEEERFQDKLRVETEVSGAEMDCQVPSLILQPLVENAIKHGITDGEKIAVIRIKTLHRNDKLHIFVEDNGPGFAVGRMDEPESGIGLSNIKARLEQIYGADHRMSVGKSDDLGGASVEISIPCEKERGTDEEE